MKKVILVALSLAALIVAGCGGNGPDDPVPENRRIVVHFNVQQLSLPGSSSKSETEEAENRVNRIIFYGVDKNSLVKKLLTEQNPALGGTEIPDVSQDIISIFAIANPSAGIEVANPQNLAEMTDMVAEFASMPSTPFIMSGIAVIMPGNVANIELIRTIAKIEFLPSSDFVITSVTVMNTPNQGYIFGKNGAVPPTAGRINYPQINSATPIIYVAENTVSSPTVFQVKGIFEEKEVSYDIPIEIEQVNYAIMRNTHYRIPIRAISEDTCIVDIIVLPWNVVVTDAYEPEEDF